MPYMSAVGSKVDEIRAWDIIWYFRTRWNNSRAYLMLPARALFNLSPRDMKSS
jgi:hypothetical protein